MKPFRCLLCNELLRESTPLASYVVRIIIVAAITLALLQRVVGVWGWLLALVLYPFVVTLVQAGLIRMFGHTLEPAKEGGRIPLGQGDE